MNKYEELSKKTIRILEITRKKADKYSIERRKLYNYLRNLKDDEFLLNEWKEYFKKFDDIDKV